MRYRVCGCVLRYVALSYDRRRIRGHVMGECLYVYDIYDGLYDKADDLD